MYDAAVKKAIYIVRSICQKLASYLWTLQMSYVLGALQKKMIHFIHVNQGPTRFSI